MVARIKIGSSLSRSFFYNENKVEQGVASCILAKNFPIEKERMTVMQKLNVLQKVASLRESLKASSVHISLNFDTSEKLSQDKLNEIATLYMDKIGFGKQPFLVYEHNDSGHPHIHILTTKVDWGGKAINTNFIARTKSEPARKELEIMFGLVKAEDSKKVNTIIKSAYAQKVNYGRTESRKAIANVLNEVIKNYKFSSIPELNAVLNQYNVKADRGSEQSRTFRFNGLHYKIIDENGKPVGVPIKASSFHNKPTLKLLEERFKNNDENKLPHKSRIKNAIDLFFLKHSNPSLNGLIKALEKDGIHTVLRGNENGILYGITYVDHQSKCVFNGSALGKAYSVKNIHERFDLKDGKPSQPLESKLKNQLVQTSETSQANPNEDSILDALLQVENSNNYIPYEWSSKKKRRRKRK